MNMFPRILKYDPFLANCNQLCLAKIIIVFSLFIFTIAGAQKGKPTVAILDITSDCEMLDPDDNPIQINGYANGVVNAQ